MLRQHTHVRLTALTFQPLGELQSISVNLLPCCLSNIIGDVEEAMVPGLALLYGKQDTALLECLTNGCQPVRQSILVYRWVIRRW